MNDRGNSIIKVQTMTRSEYFNSKHIPNSSPLYVHQPDPRHFLPQETPLPFDSKPTNPTIPTKHARRPSSTGRPSSNQSYDTLVRENQDLKQRLDELHQDLYNSNQKNCELQASCGELLKNKAYLEEELNKLRVVRTRLESELEEARRLLKSNGLVSSSSQIDQLLAERNYLEMEVKRANEELEHRKQDKIRVVNDYEQKLTQLHNQLNALRNEAERAPADQQIGDLQRYLDQSRSELGIATILFSTEIERLHTVLGEKLKENAELKGKLEEKAMSNRTTPQKPKESNKSAGLPHFGTEAIDENQLFELQRKIDDYERKLDGMTTSNRELRDEVDNWKSKYTMLEKAHQATSTQINAGQLNASSLNGDERSRFEATIRSLKALNVDYENKIVLYMIEIDRLHVVVENILGEIEHWQARYQAREKEYEAEIQQVRAQFEDYHKKSLENQSRDSTARLEIETGSLMAQLQAYRKRNEDLELLFNNMRNDIHKLKRDLFDKNTEVESWKIKYQMLERKYHSDLQNVRRELELKVQTSKVKVTGNEEMEGTERSLVEKLLRTQKDRINDLEEITKALQAQMDKARKEGADKDNSAEKWKMRCEIFEKKLQLEGISVTFSEDEQARFIYHRPDVSPTVLMHNLEMQPLNAQLKLYKEWTQDLLNLIANLQNEIQMHKKELFDKSLETEGLIQQIKVLERNHQADSEQLRGEFEYFLNAHKVPADLIKDFRSWYSKPAMRDSQAMPMFDPSSFNESRCYTTKPTMNDDHSVEFEKSTNLTPKCDRSLSEKPGALNEISNFSPQENTGKSRRSEDPTQIYKAAVMKNALPLADGQSSAKKNKRPEAYESTEKPKRRGEKEKRSGMPDELNQSFDPNNRENVNVYPVMVMHMKPVVSGTGFGQTPEQMLGKITNSAFVNKPQNLNESIDMRSSLPIMGAGGRGNRFDTAGSDGLKRSYVQQPSERSVLESTQYDSLPSRKVDSAKNSSNAIPSSTSIQEALELKAVDRSTSEDPRGVNLPKGMQGISLTYLKKLHETEVRFVIVSVELERINVLLKQKEQEFDTLREKYHSNEKLHATQIDHMKNKFENLLKSQVEKEMTNASGNWNSERHAMERQLTAQKEQLSEYESKIKQLNDELGKLQQENMRLGANERNLKFELEKAKITYDTALRQNLSNELSDQNTKFSQERIELENDLRNHKLKSEDLENKALYLMRENDRLSNVIEERDLAIDRLLNDNKERAKDLQEMHNRLYEVENQKYMEITELKKRYEEDKHVAIQKELGRQQNDHNIQICRLQDELNFLKSRCTEQEDQIRNLSDTMERQAFNLQSKDKDLELLRKRLREAEDYHAQEKEELREDFDRQLKNRVDAEVKRITDRLGLEKHSAEHDSILLKQRVGELEEDLKELQKKFEKASQDFDDASRESENWKLRFEQLNSRFNMDIKQLQGEYEIKIRNQLKKEIDDMKSNFDRERTMLEDFVKKLRTRGSELEVRQVMLMIEVDRQSNISKKQAETIEANKAKEIELNKKCQDQIDQIKSEMEEVLKERLASEMEEATKKAARERETLTAQIDGLKKRQAQLEAYIEELNQEKEKLNAEKNKAERELEDFKFKHEEALREHENALELQKSRLHEEYGKHLKEVGLTHDREKDGLFEEIDDLKAKLEDLENKLALMALENERLRMELKDKQDRVEALQGQMEQIERDAKAHIEGLQNDFERARREQELRAQQEIARLQDEIQEHEQQIGDRDKHIDELRNELKRIGDAHGEREREAEDLKKLVDDLHRNYQNQMRSQYQQQEQEKKKETEKALKEQACAFEQEKAKDKDQFEREKQALSADFAKKMQKLESDKENERKTEVANLKRALEEEKRAELGNLRKALEEERESEIENLQRSFAMEKATEIGNLTRAHEIEKATEIKNLRRALEEDKKVELGNLRRALEEEKATEIGSLQRTFEMEKAAQAKNLRRAFEDEKNAEIGSLRRALEDEKRVELGNLQRALENEKLNEIKNLKRAHEDDKAAELNRLRRALEDERRVEISNLNRAHDEEKAAEIRNLRNALEDEKRTEIGNLKRNYENEKESLMGHLNGLTNERDQLIKMHEAAINEIETLKHEFDAMARAKDNEIFETKKNLQAEMAERLAEQESAHNQERMRYEGQIRNASQQLADLSQEHRNLTEELNNLNRLLAGKEKELEDAKKAMQSLEHEKTTEVEELQIQFEHFKRTQIGSGEFEIRFYAEKAALESEILELQEKLRRSEEDKWSLEKELRRVKESGQGGFSLVEKNKELLAKIKELDDLKKKYEEAMANINIAPIKTIIQSKTITKENSKLGDHH